MKTKYLNPNSIPHPDRGAEKLYYLSHWLWRKKKHRLAKIIQFVNAFIFGSHIHPNASIGKRLELAHGGFGVVINKDAIIGDDAIIFHNVTLGNGGALIGDRVTIGTGSVLLGAIIIGNDVAIGANTVVNFSVPDGATVVGKKGIILKNENKGLK